MTRKDWTLLVIAAAHPRPVKPVHLQKVLFLIDRRLTGEQRKVSNFYHFDPYDYGPFCSDIYSDAEWLVDEGLVHIDSPPHQSYRLYSVTEEGKNQAAVLAAELAPEVREYLTKLLTWATSLTFKELVSTIYREFPEMKANSVFQE